MAVSDLVKTIVKNDGRLLNIIEFVESKKHLNIKLYPVQRVIFKLIYGIPLSDDISDDPIILKDDFNEVILYTFTSEIEFVEFLVSEKKLNSSDIIDPMEVLFFVGRRGTKTTMISMMVSYTIYVILEIGNPHEYFGIVLQSEIGIAVVSNKTSNASKQLREISNMVYGSKYFSEYIVSKEPSKEGFFMKTKYGKNNPDKRVGLINIQVFAATPSVRGSSNIVVVLDEFAHYIDSDNPQRLCLLTKKFMKLSLLQSLVS